MKTLIPLLDNEVSFNPGDIIFVAGNEDAIDAVMSGLVMTSEDIDWICLSDKKLVPPKPVNISYWTKEDFNFHKPKPGTLMVLDGIQAQPTSFRWEKMIERLKDFAEAKESTLVIVASDESDRCQDDPKDFLPNSIVEHIRSRSTYEIMLYSQHASEIQCIITNPKDPDNKITKNLGAPADLAEMVVKRVKINSEMAKSP